MATHEGAEHHKKAAEHHKHAAKHHEEAAKSHEEGDHETGAITHTPRTGIISRQSIMRRKRRNIILKNTAIN